MGVLESIPHGLGGLLYVQRNMGESLACWVGSFDWLKYCMFINAAAGKVGKDPVNTLLSKYI